MSDRLKPGLLAPECILEPLVEVVPDPSSGGEVWPCEVFFSC